MEMLWRTRSRFQEQTNICSFPNPTKNSWKHSQGPNQTYCRSSCGSPSYSAMEKRNDCQKQTVVCFFFFCLEKKNQIDMQSFSGDYQNVQVILIKQQRSRQPRRISHCNKQHNCFQGNIKAGSEEKKSRTKLTNFGTVKCRIIQKLLALFRQGTTLF